jgi:hypothetical protein
MTIQKAKVQVSLDTYEMDQKILDSIPASFYRWFHLGPSTYAVLKNEDKFSILKCVEHDGHPELHDIESESEFQIITEHFLQLEGRVEPR